MNRRYFLKISSMGAMALLVNGCGFSVFGSAAELVRYMEWENVGTVMAVGCGSRSLVEKSDFGNQAEKIGVSL